ncbi:hypothetical protein TVNIR_0803 [Thioalkalivibrio nitratireducens DSM 14787]|uniref:Uncharacterized protein n=1 Tax=Thioalkalivibrio nitratireducens (strain DSM 14787 / UNIQEM 213 / ALEN2) TaxID=1255043 RepID=L0DTZ8_THIND|nr:hypothetical protein TVNIR_0803 [Thioalkalivibrio nitratireducens DSM 14787]
MFSGTLHIAHRAIMLLHLAQVFASRLRADEHAAEHRFESGYRFTVTGYGQAEG